MEELFSSSETEVRGVESTPKGPEVKREFAAAVLRAEPRRGWLGGGAPLEEGAAPFVEEPLAGLDVGEEGTWVLLLGDLKVDEEGRDASRWRRVGRCGGRGGK